MFVALTYSIAAIVAAFAIGAYRGTRDVFHPAIICGSMLFFLYVYMPLRLLADDTLQAYLREDQAVFAQLVNLVGVTAVMAGIWRGQRSWKASRQHRQTSAGRLFTGSVILGVLGLSAHVYMLAFVGGFAAAYGESYGGGSADLGYIRDATVLIVPATLTIFFAWPAIRFRFIKVLLCAAFMAPLAAQAVLGARRGPTFMVLTTVIAGWYLVRRRRPPFAVAAAGGLTIGVLMLFLVANREEIHLGSEWELRRAPTAILEAGEGNDYLFGAGAIVTATENGAFTWGRRYLTIFLVRPIPRLLWPTKYEDAAAWLGTPSMEVNVGIDPEAFQSVVGWTGALGAAPGLVADLWVEFSWGSIALLALIGWFLGRAWRRERSHGGFSTLLYAMLMAVSVYLVMQTVEAMVLRLIEMAVPAWLVWWWAIRAHEKASSEAFGERGSPAGSVVTLP
jgi:hypothetical protein